jgi:hypothetical protein
MSLDSIKRINAYRALLNVFLQEQAAFQERDELKDAAWAIDLEEDRDDLEEVELYWLPRIRAWE